MSLLLETEHLRIEAPSFDYFEEICALESDPDVMCFIGGVRTREASRMWLEKAIQLYEKHGFSMGVVFEKRTGEFIGRAGIVHLTYDDTQPEVEIGCRLHKAHWNHGEGGELIKAEIEWGFQSFGLKKLVGIVHPQNTRSRHVLEKIGMQYVGQVNYYNTDLAKYEIYSKETG